MWNTEQTPRAKRIKATIVFYPIVWFNYDKMKREELLEYLAKQDIQFSFEYDPYGEPLMICSNEFFKDFLLEVMFDYVMGTGDPVGGDFTASRKNGEIIITSVGNIEADWNHANIEDVAISEDYITEIEGFFCNTFTTKAEDDWCYYLYVSKRGLKYELKAEVYVGDCKEEMQKDEFPKEIAANIIYAISGPNDDDTDNYGFDFKLTNSGDGNQFTEYYSLSFTL